MQESAVSLQLLEADSSLRGLYRLVALVQPSQQIGNLIENLFVRGNEIYQMSEGTGVGWT